MSVLFLNLILRVLGACVLTSRFVAMRTVAKTMAVEAKTTTRSPVAPAKVTEETRRSLVATIAPAIAAAAAEAFAAAAT